MANNHFIARALTKPWEHDDRRLTFYDFETKSVRTVSSKSLFAEENLHDDALESFFKKTIEDPLCRLRDQTEAQAYTIEDWETYRAAYLYFAMQAPRDQLAKSGNERIESLEALKKIATEPNYPDFLAKELKERYRAVALNMPCGKPLYFAGTGFFQFNLRRTPSDGGFVFAYALPMSPYRAIGIVPIAGDFEYLHTHAGMLEWYYIGVNERQNKVVIPKSMFATVSPEEIGKQISEARPQVIKCIADAHRANELRDQMRKIAGLPPIGL